jgi:hypothetical protein
VRRIQRQIDIALAGAGYFTQRLAGNRGQVGIVFAVDGATQSPPIKLS